MTAKGDKKIKKKFRMNDANIKNAKGRINFINFLQYKI